MSGSCKEFMQALYELSTHDENGNVTRKKEWPNLDPNGNGQVSLAETDAWVLKKMTERLGAEEGERVYNCFKPSYIRAFSDAKDLVKGEKRKLGPTADAEDYIQPVEFRGLAAYLCLYAAMYDCFALLDGGDGVDVKGHEDRKMTLEEWQNGYKKVVTHGFVGLKDLGEADAATVESAFNEMNSGRTGTKETATDNVVMLVEFCAWIEKKEADAGTTWGKLLTAGEQVKEPAPAVAAAPAEATAEAD
eukprot:GSMAST32.ASY1.ANO1.570.1 assembled CDS